MKDTDRQFEQAVARCRTIFKAKLDDYGASWRIMRPEAITDQLYIKAKRIRTLQIKGMAAVDEGILPEFMAIVNYGIIGILQLREGFSDRKDMSPEQALALYDSIADGALKLMKAKNHDYDEAWRMMRVLSFDDIILTKLERVKEIEDHKGVTTVSEGIESNYLDIINYAVFAIIKLTEDPANG